jgi:MscS family membrane protein
METSDIAALLEHELLGIATWIYLAALGFVLLGFVGRKIVSLVFGHLNRLTEKTRIPFDNMLIKALVRPLEWSVVVGGVFAAIFLFPLPTEPIDIERFFGALLSAWVGGMMIWFGLRLVNGLMDWWGAKAALTESKLDDQLVPIVRRSLKVFLVLIGGMLILQNLGYSVLSLLTGLGIGGAALALASKDAISNLFGSIVVFLDKPFQVGDWIEIGGLEGTVEEVGLRTTRIRTFANSLITVPNSLFSTTAINNWSRMRKRRIMMTVGITYDSPPEKVDGLVLRIRELIAGNEKLHGDFYLVNLDKFGPSSLDIFVYCFTRSTVWGEFLQAKQEFMLDIMRSVRDAGLEFAFPTQSVHIESLPPRFEAALALQGRRGEP